MGIPYSTLTSIQTHMSKKRCRDFDEDDGEPSDAESLGKCVYVCRPLYLYLSRSYRKPRLRRRRVFKRRVRSGRGATVGRVRRVQAFPERMFIKLKYSQDIRMSLGTLPTNTPGYVFRGNSLYDPDYSGTGGEPYAYSIYSQIYNRYRVYGSKIRCKFGVEGLNSGQANGGGAKFYIVPFNAITPIAGTLDEAPNVRRAIWFAPYSRSPTLKSYCSTAKAWGISKATASTNAEFSAAKNADPASPWYWIVAARHHDDTTIAASTLAIVVNVTLVYYVCMYDRNWFVKS